MVWESVLGKCSTGEAGVFGGRFLSLLATGDGRAVASWKGLAARGRWAWWLKDWIDRGFVERFPSGAAAR